MATVPYEDDDIRRYVVHRYAFEAARNERCHVVAAVVDNKREFQATLSQLAEELELRRAAGETVDPREHISGVVLDPGHLARAATGHLVRRAMKRGIWPTTVAPEDLPHNMRVLSLGDGGQ